MVEFPADMYLIPVLLNASTPMVTFAPARSSDRSAGAFWKALSLILIVSPLKSSARSELAANADSSTTLTRDPWNPTTASELQLAHANDEMVVIGRPKKSTRRRDVHSENADTPIAATFESRKWRVVNKPHLSNAPAAIVTGMGESVWLRSTRTSDPLSANAVVPIKDTTEPRNVTLSNCPHW
jgi:hypothetical protein